MFAELYKIPEADIMTIVWFAPANAVNYYKKAYFVRCTGQTDITALNSISVIQYKF